jgi:hypothetical protein
VDVIVMCATLVLEEASYLDSGEAGDSHKADRRAEQRAESREQSREQRAESRAYCAESIASPLPFSNTGE